MAPRRASESTPLLDDSIPPTSPNLHPNDIDDDAPPPHEAADKPLPKKQMLLLCYARLMEPIAFFCIFPFIAPMVQRNGELDESDVGFYSGPIECIFSATQAVVLIFWSRLADRIGRKPALVYSLLGMTITPALFGVSTSITEMVLFRCLAGVFSGSTLIIRTMIGDHCTPKTQAVAFSWFAFAGNIGIFLGPVIGGMLADPAEQFPSLFEGVPFFVNYPYALPGFVVGAISATGALTSALFLEETLQTKPRSLESGTPADEDDQDDKTSIWELLQAPGVKAVIWIYQHVMFLAFSFTAVLPIMMYTRIGNGGMGFSKFQIAMYMAAQGASQAIWLLVAFPKIHRRIGTKGIMWMCSYFYPVFFAGYIAMNALARQGPGPQEIWFWTIGGIVALVGPGVSMSFTGVQLAVNDVSPAPHLLGTLNAITMTGASAMRAFVPALATAVYAIGVGHEILWGQLVWVILIPIAMGLWICLRWLPNDKR